MVYVYLQTHVTEQNCRSLNVKIILVNMNTTFQMFLSACLQCQDS
jgi:hypothetical protein